MDIASLNGNSFGVVQTESMYARSAAFYDAIYGFKDYPTEVATLLAIVRSRNPHASSLLDVACGTGKHLELLKASFDSEGLDLEPEFVEIASERTGVPVHRADFKDFNLGKSFDVVTCLFSAIGYAGSAAGLNSAIGCMARHLNPGGVLIVEPWLSREEYRAGTTHHMFIELPDLKIARMNYSDVDGILSVMDMHHLVATPTEVHHFVERHELAMFSEEQYVSAFRAAELEVGTDPEGLMGRGLYVGQKKS